MATKIYCAVDDCEFRNDKGRCTSNTVCLSDNSVMTAWDGRKRFNRCLTYQKSERAKEFEKKFAALAQAISQTSVTPWGGEAEIGNGEP